MNPYLLSKNSFFKLLIAKKQNIVLLNKTGLSKLGLFEPELDLNLVKKKIIGSTEKVRPVTLIFNSTTDELEILKGRKKADPEDNSIFSNMFIKHENVDYIVTHEMQNKDIFNQLESHYSSPEISHISIFNDLDCYDYCNFILENVNEFIKKELSYLTTGYFLVKSLPYVVEGTSLYKLDFLEEKIVKTLMYEDDHDNCYVYMDAFGNEIRDVVRYS